MLKFCFTTKLSNSHDASLQCLLAGPQPEGQPGAITPRKFSKTRFVVRYKLQSFPPPKISSVAALFARASLYFTLNETSSSFVTSLWGIWLLGSACILLRRFKLAYICLSIVVTHSGDIRKWIPCNLFRRESSFVYSTHLRSCKQ